MTKLPRSLHVAIVSFLSLALSSSASAQVTAGPDRVDSNQALILNGGSAGVIANGWKFVAQRQFMMNMAMQRAVTEQALHRQPLEALPDGELVVPKTHFVRTSDVDMATVFADMMARQLRQHSVAEYTRYVRTQLDDFTHTTELAHQPLDSFPTACTYYIKTLYAIGANQIVQTDRESDIVRGSCVLLLSSLQTQGKLTSDKERQIFYDTLAIVATGLRSEFTDAQRKSDKQAEAITQRAAHDLLIQSTGYDPAVLPLSRLPCAFISVTQCNATLPKLQEFLISGAKTYQ